MGRSGGSRRSVRRLCWRRGTTPSCTPLPLSTPPGRSEPESNRFLGIMLGDTGTELVHDAVCSVLLACPADDHPWQPRKTVVGFDGSNHSLAALRMAEELARAFSGSVEVVAATGGKPVECDAAWSDRVDTWVPAHPVAALVERSRTVDLVVVGSRGVHGLRALGSVSERVAHQAHCTALVVHEPKAESSA
jgi:hypothetical protein